jgi:hypothetical protein
MPNAIMLSDYTDCGYAESLKLCAVILNVIMLNAIALSVVAPH